MHDQPSPQLLALLERLRLASPEALRQAARSVRRLGREIPQFESIWVDALADARVLTPFQAAEINAGRAAGLTVGPYVLKHPLPSTGYAACFAARDLDTAVPARVSIVKRVHRPLAELKRELQRLLASGESLRQAGWTAIERAAAEADHVWAASPAVSGRTAAEWMVENGRFPPDVALHIARTMVQQLIHLEDCSRLHGDISARGLLLGDDGAVAMPHPGLRNIVRPAEGHTFHDLPPESYDYLAPERISEGTPVNLASEMFACGSLWWHLLTGRPAFPGGNALAKLHAVHGARAIDVRLLAPETPPVLADAVMACLARDPARRPANMRALSARLGCPNEQGRLDLAHCLTASNRVQLGWIERRRKPIGRGQAALAALTTAAAILLGVGVAVWYSGRSTVENNLASGDVVPTPSEPFKLRTEDIRQPLLEVASAPESSSKTLSLTRTSPDSVRLASAEASETPRLILPADGSLRWDQLQLKRGQVIQGANGSRPVIRVSQEGLKIEVEDLRFEHVDFIWTDASQTDALDDRDTARSAVVAATVHRVEFRGCSFQTESNSAQPVTAIRWSDASARDASDRFETNEDGAELTLTDCVFDNVESAVEWSGRGVATLDATNVLHLGPGPLVRLTRCPAPTESVNVSMQRVTLRGCNCAFEWRYPELLDPAGALAILATDSAVAIDRGGALLVFDGPERPSPLLRSLQWSGQGSLLATDVLVAAWRDPDTGLEPIGDEEIEIAGLVRSRIQFAGQAEGGPAASRMTRWQAPLRSPDPPGAYVEDLHLPERGQRRGTTK